LPLCAYPIGYFHIDIAEVQTAEGKLYLYVAIDRTSKFAFIQLVKKTGRTSPSVFLMALIKAVPYKIHTVLTDNGVKFTFRPRYADGPTARYMTHMFDMRCASGKTRPFRYRSTPKTTKKGTFRPRCKRCQYAATARIRQSMAEHAIVRNRTIDPRRLHT